MRNDVKNAIAAAVRKATGITTVYTYSQKITPQTAYPVCFVSLPKAHESRGTAQAPVGKKFIKYTAQLDIFNIDTSPTGSGQTTFEDLLDSIDFQLRQDPSLGGVVLGAGIEHIDTTLAPPQLIDGQNIVLLSIKQFDVLVQVTG